jgi:hypothetical protein
MNPESTRKKDLFPEMANDLPYISLILPFEPKMNTIRGLDIILNTARVKIEKEVRNSYPEAKALPVLKKFNQMLMALDHTIHNKSIAIFASPLVEKVYYFNYSTKKMDNYKTTYM